MLFTKSELNLKIKNLVDERDMFSSKLAELEEKTREEVCSDEYYVVLEFHDCCCEMIDLYTDFLINNF
jgi:hypothetical protein